MKKIRLPKIRLPKIRMSSKVKRVMIGLAVLVVLILILNLFWRPLLLWQLFPWLVNKMVSNTGMNIWLARALAIPIAVLLILAITLMFSLKKKKRIAGFILLCLMISIGSIAMYQFTKEHRFEFGTGGSRQWYVRTLQGFRLYSTSGYDVVTGEKLKKITEEIAKEIEIWEEKAQKVIKPIQEEYHFFNFSTGRHVRWYYKDEKGRIEIFDKPGFHPKYGERLLPVDKEVVKEYEEQIENEIAEKEREKKEKIKEKVSSGVRKKAPEKTVVRPVTKILTSEKEEKRKEGENNRYDTEKIARQIKIIQSNLEHLKRYCGVLPQGPYLRHVKKINNAVFQLSRIELPKSRNLIETLIATWEVVYLFSGVYLEAAEAVSSISTILASVGEKESILFIEQYLYEIEKRSEEGTYLKTGLNQVFYDEKGRILRTRRDYYNGEEVLIKVIDALEKNLDKPDCGAIKDLLILIAKKASSQQVRYYAARVLAQHKKHTSF